MILAKPAQRRDSGFTLLELLIAMAILGLTVVALTGGVRFAGHAWEIQQRRSAPISDIDAVQSVLRTLIASGRGFDGDAGSLRFVGTLPRALERAGLYDLELRVSPTRRLLLAWKPQFKGPALPPQQTETELITGVASLELGYYIAAVGWQREYSAEMRPPALVRIGVRLDAGRRWPPLVVAPMIDGRQPGRAKGGA
jgi:prepilin-type N-terminal cleavage/methylation domain-containing protein